jgi:RimJ/RimL family protein N-acetyltransferase
MRVGFNQLSKSGKLEYRIAQNLDEISSELDTFFKFHEERRFMLGDRSKFENGNARKFYKCLIEGFFPDGWLRFDMLKLDGEPVAYHFGFLYDDTLVYYTPTFNLDYFKRSPGTVLFKSMLEDCLTRNIRQFDFARGAESYKERFANEIRKNLRIGIYKNAFSRMALELPMMVKYSIKSKYPKTYSILKSRLNPSKIVDYKEDFVFVTSRIGLWKSIAKFAMKLYRIFIYKSQDIIIFKADRDERDRPVLNDSFRIREGRFSDLKNFIKSTPQEQRLFLVTALDRLKNGDRLYVVEKDGRIIHYAWATVTKKIELLEIHTHLNLEEDSGYTFHGYTLDDFRGYGIYPAVMSRIIDDIRKDNVKQVYVYCLQNNHASRRSIEKAGFTPFRSMGMTRFLGITHRRSKPLI